MNWSTLLWGGGGPLLAVIFGIAGVFLGRYIARGIHKEGEEKLSNKVNIALMALFSLAVVGWVRENPTSSPLRMLGYSSAAGFIGLGLLEFIASQLQARLKAAWDGFMNPNGKPSADEAGIQKALAELDKVEYDDGPKGQ